MISLPSALTPSNIVAAATVWPSIFSALLRPSRPHWFFHGFPVVAGDQLTRRPIKER